MTVVLYYTSTPLEIYKDTWGSGGFLAHCHFCFEKKDEINFSLRKVVVPPTKILIKLFWTFEKLRSKEEPYRLSG